MVDREAVLAVHRDGIEALAGFGATAPAELWDRQACGIWTGADLAGHVLAVSRWYHDWLDRAEQGDSDPPFPSKRLATENQQALNALPEATGPQRLADFRRSATDYLDRVADHWDLPYGCPVGTIKAGQHAALAAMEWHAHAWDLARAIEKDHHPIDPDTLATAVIDAWTARRGIIPRTTQRALADVAKRTRDPWHLLLKNTGRHPEEGHRG